MVDFLQAIVDKLNAILIALDDLLGYINSTDLPIHTGQVARENWQFFLEVQAPLMGEWIDKLSIFFAR
ncbi:MAG: hypothetical protein HUJ63_09060 [Enterococcus sp.]|nr:hypothetical protein [Enterococcus sp.]